MSIRRSAALAAAAVAAVSSVALAMLAGGSDEPVAVGPLDLGAPWTETETSVSSDVGGVVVWGSIVLRNRGTQPLVIDKVELVPTLGAESGVRLDGAYIVDLEGRPPAKTGVVRRWPPPIGGDAVRPASGFRIEPRAQHVSGYELLFRLTVLRAGDWRFESYAIEYVVDGVRYRASHDDALRVCTPERSDCARPR